MVLILAGGWTLQWLEMVVQWLARLPTEPDSQGTNPDIIKYFFCYVFFLSAALYMDTGLFSHIFLPVQLAWNYTNPSFLFFVVLPCHQLVLYGLINVIKLSTL